MEFTLKTTLKATAKQIYKSGLSTQGYTKMARGAVFALDKVGDTFTVCDGFIKLITMNIFLRP